jgi:hypothetical protein
MSGCSGSNAAQLAGRQAEGDRHNSAINCTTNGIVNDVEEL